MEHAVRQDHADRVPVAAPSPSTVVTRGLAGFLAMKDDWNDLFERAARPHHVFQSYAFLRHWAGHYADGPADIIIVGAWIDGRLAMAWPLLATRRLGLSVLEFMGAPTAQFFDLLIAPDADRRGLFEAGWAAIGELGADVFVARNLKDDSALAELAGERMTELAGATSAPFANLARRVEGDAPGPAYSGKDRSNYRRRLRRIEDHGALQFGGCGPGPEAAALVATCIAYKRRSLLARLIWSPTVMDPKFEGFFTSLAGDAESGLRISTIACDGRPIGIDLSFDCRDSAFGHVLASDPDCPHEGIGSLLVHRTFIAAAKRGIRVFELMAPADPYKMRHADGETRISTRVAAFSGKGRLYRDLYLGRIEPALKSVARRFAGPLIARAVSALRPSARPF